MNTYRMKVWDIIRPLIGAVDAGKILDFGCGDGWFASQVKRDALCGELVAVDVKRRDGALVEPIIYAGGDLPFESAAFDLTYAVDVLHHCEEPIAQLDELMRVTRGHILIKDHNHFGAAGRWTLAVLDELGNRKFGIPSPYHYQKKWAWRKHMSKNGWNEQFFLHPAPCHSGLMGSATNSLQYVALYSRGR